ncbi:hypothetical protein [Crenothrix polyspora]|uniref:Uncharacterized protein n=1 Tax=Crenothrix polyspora TaxID=360316 RepID=A0A1R4H3G7_9GAMM|nr:hypothetical protein [Crenothrix polyspora]SJM90782.1 conserved hypothetical protein [Crenothrix polyspora]
MNKLSADRNPTTDKPTSSDARYAPARWWQWILVHPTLFIALLSPSVPTLIETIKSVKLGVGYGQSEIAELQNTMWRTNHECAKAPFKGYATKTNIQVDGTICKSGDVLLRVAYPNKEPGYWWVPLEGIIKNNKMGGLITAANAASDSAPIIVADAVLCQRFITDGQLLRRIDTGQGCFDEIVNTYTGQVIQRNPVACSNTC